MGKQVWGGGGKWWNYSVSNGFLKKRTRKLCNRGAMGTHAFEVLLLLTMASHCVYVRVCVCM